MATLTLPTTAAAFIDDNGKPGKFHLLNVNQDPDNPNKNTACHLLWPYYPHAMIKNIADLEPEQLCKKCLGAMKATP